jgi:hypothetical protein
MGKMRNVYNRPNILIARAEGKRLLEELDKHGKIL